ncbi:uracil phosphoribosyltransferase-domain-containing protein [Apiospora phragmitis]|uniref:Uracil phosphoribosyltransferase-domain-containing protein n=1 Tax=Apiospora phragmitis TaxID=2905665 RepID=A0ABR1TNL4_9PEZI
MDIYSDQTHTLSPSPTATVISLYSIPGSGKTFLLSQLRQQQGLKHFELYEGSNVIDSLVPGRLDAFKRAEEHDKASWLPTLLRDFQHHSEERNSSRANNRLDEALSTQKHLQTVLVLNADKTLATVDTGELFWRVYTDEHDMCPLKTLFGGPLGYSYTAFRQAMLLYEEAADERGFDALCDLVASKVEIHPEFVFLLHLVAAHDHVGAVVVTLIGGGRVADSFVVTAAVKASLISRLRVVHKTEADRAVVVVGPSRGRSRTINGALSTAIEQGSLRANQVLLPGHASPRLNVAKLPLLQLHDPEFLQAVFDRRIRSTGVRMLHAIDKNAAKLLMTSTRDARIQGTALRKAHARVGEYLALEYLSEWVRVEQVAIPHVQGQQTTGFRMHRDEHTSIIALMRGGEPLAQGIAKVFENAMFLYAQDPQNVKAYHLAGQSTVLLVDSVVNSGKSVVQFIQHIRELHATIRIVVIAGVVQAQSSQEGGLLYALSTDANFGIIALRVSDNKFIGSGGTDTSNRLFNTTYMP